MNINFRMVFFVFCFSMFLGFSKAMAQTSGTFMVVKGDVSVTTKDGKTEKAKVGKKIFPSDTITAGADSRAKVVMADQNVINISPDTKLLLEKYIYDPANNNKQVVLNVLEGKVRSTVEQKYDGEKNQFHVKTPAAVAGVRGTDFLTSFNTTTRETKIVTFSGKVEVGLPGPGGTIQNPVFVTPGQMSTSTAGAAPTPPMTIPKEDFNSMSNSTKADSPKSEEKSTPTGAKEETKNKDSDKKDAPEKNESANNTSDKKADGNKNPENSTESNKEAKNNGANPNGKSNENSNNANNGPNNGPNANGTAKNDGPMMNNAPSGTERGPASMLSPGNNIGGSPMFDPSKEFTAVSGSLPGPMMPHIGPQIPSTNQVILPPTSSFIDSQLQNGRTKLNININKQP